MIAAIDPGKMSGLATLRDDLRFDSWQATTWEAVKWVDLSMRHLEAVVCEDYIITMQTLKKTRGENWSLESIGALRYLCLEGNVPFFTYTPTDGKSFSTDAKLKKAGWWNPTKGGHANDAARHLLLHLARTNRLSLVL